MPSVNRKIAIIGAGAAGLCTAKYLLDDGHDVTVFEIGTQVGGIWVYDNDNGRSSAYKSLHVNSERRTTHFRAMPFADGVQLFPSHTEMREYLSTFAHSFGIYSRVRFNSRVTAVRGRSIDGSDGVRVAWSVTVNDSDTEDFDSVVVATGHLTDPMLPDFVDDFTGELMHSHYYRESIGYAGKRVLVVGAGNSGCDITADVCTVADRTVMSVRSPELVAPKLFLGVPLTQITAMFEKRWLPASTPVTVRNLITLLVHGRMETWGLRTPDYAKHPTSHPTLINHIAYKRVEVKPGIREVAGRCVTFTDGTAEDFDAIICATGYDIKLPFIDEPVAGVVDGSLPLYRRVVPPEYPGIYFIGFSNAAASSNLRMYEYQAEWIADLESGRVLLPTVAQMWEGIAGQDAWVRSKYPAGPRHALEVDPRSYTTELEKERAEGDRPRPGERPCSRRMQSRSVEDRTLALSVSPLQAAAMTQRGE
ncbi:hypothetical protein AXA44_30940 [Rhodococcus sp. SC4]|nr:hypothetical protein AXA44_30940 [Rhodococcus sp. SC4]